MGSFLDPQRLLENFSYIGLFAVVFAESGLLVGFFLPGDTLLFAAGLFTTRTFPGTNTRLHIVAVCLVCVTAAISGDQVGYVIGRRAGPALFRRPNSRVFKQKYVTKSQDFFAEHGAKTILLARFIAIVRTFAPVIAGVGHMKYRTFVRYNVIGGILWGVGLPVAGHFLGRNDFINSHLEVMVLIILAISLLPVAIELVRARLKRKSRAAVVPEAEIAADD